VPKVLLSVPHLLQRSDGDCLAACAAMVLAYLDRVMDYAELLSLLKIKPHGAPAGNIRLLAKLNLNVVYSKTDMAGLEAMLQQGQPVIVFVRTGELPYWEYSTDHALLVVGYDEDQWYVNDPYCSEAPIAVPYRDFELAWLEHDYRYALITPARAHSAQVLE
jgi:ABC-type bacteriocin/lantibiotic exporter with double-glycine peptidase domain